MHDFVLKILKTKERMDERKSSMPTIDKQARSRVYAPGWVESKNCGLRNERRVNTELQSIKEGLNFSCVQRQRHRRPEK